MQFLHNELEGFGAGAMLDLRVSMLKSWVRLAYLPPAERRLYGAR